MFLAIVSLRALAHAQITRARGASRVFTRARSSNQTSSCSSLPWHDVDGAVRHAARGEDEAAEQPESRGGAFAADQPQEEWPRCQVKPRAAQPQNHPLGQPADEEAQP